MSLPPLSRWPEYRFAWLILAASATSFVLIALYFQYVMYLEPCVQCIYQRTAMIGLALVAWIVAINPRAVALRVFGFAGWLTAAGAGLASAHHHVWLQTRANPLFVMCSPYPEFPDWLPLDVWMPSLFAAGGLCTDNTWSFMGLVMSEWMRIIFAIYLLVGIVIGGIYGWKKLSPLLRPGNNH
ncbi:MAG: disulfide bond formation protein DsbB [Idiomarina sp.]|nr:disulfide bond formation protein DsbB [Idiomarina sp.]